MKTLIKVLALLLLPTLVSAGAYRDTYEIEVQREIQQLDNKVQHGRISTFEKKRKEYLEKRLKRIQTVGITRITFSSNIYMRQPVDSITFISYKKRKVYLFTAIKNMRGKYITHVWYFNNEPVYKKRFKVRRSFWYAWTKKIITKNMIGKWKGVILDDTGKVMATKHFKVTR